MSMKLSTLKDPCCSPSEQSEGTTTGSEAY